MKLTRSHPLFESFLSLTCQLSPENLCCDGECSRAETERRHKAIMVKWWGLEKKFGRPVTEDDVWNAEFNHTFHNEGKQNKT